MFKELFVESRTWTKLSKTIQQKMNSEKLKIKSTPEEESIIITGDAETLDKVMKLLPVMVSDDSRLVLKPGVSITIKENIWQNLKNYLRLNQA